MTAADQHNGTYTGFSRSSESTLHLDTGDALTPILGRATIDQHADIHEKPPHPANQKAAEQRQDPSKNRAYGG